MLYDRTGDFVLFKISFGRERRASELLINRNMLPISFANFSISCDDGRTEYFSLALIYKGVRWLINNFLF